MFDTQFAAIKYTGKKRKRDDVEEEDPSNQPSKRAKRYALDLL